MASHQEQQRRRINASIPYAPHRLGNMREQAYALGRQGLGRRGRDGRMLTCRRRKRRDNRLLYPMHLRHRGPGHGSDRSRCERRRRGAQAIRCARSIAQRLCTCKTLGGIERHRHASHICQRDGNAMRIALLAHVAPRFGISPRQAKEQQRAERINIATHARLPKTVLLGRRIGTRAKLNGIGIGTVTPDTRDPQINNHQRGKGHAGISRVSHARHDDVRRLKIAMDNRCRRLPRRRKAGMELAHRIAQDGI